MGGYTRWDPLTITTDVYVYDPAAGTSGTWTKLDTSLPEPLTHAGTAVDDRDIYLAGGYVGRPNLSARQVFASRNVWKYNVDTKRWDEMPPLPEARGAGGFVRMGRQLHYFGGSDLSRADRVQHWALSLDNPHEGWRTLTPLPEPRNHLGAAVLNGRIYAIGGQTGQDDKASYHHEVYVWDPLESWSPAASLPSARSHILETTFVMGERIIVIGGDRLPDVAINDVTAYDPEANAWTVLTNLPQRLHAGVAAEIGGTVYFTMGGGNFSKTTYRGIPAQ
jgi:N-acetylneuraminic acid mutarotase